MYKLFYYLTLAKEDNYIARQFFGISVSYVSKYHVKKNINTQFHKLKSYIKKNFKNPTYGILSCFFITICQTRM